MLDSAAVHSHPAFEGAPQASSIDIMQLAKLLLRRSPIIIMMFLIGGALGLASQSLVRPKYTSSASVLITPRSPTTFGAQAAFADAVYVDSAKIASIASVVLSEEVLTRVVEQQKLADDPYFSAASSGLISRVLAFAGLKKMEPPANDLEAREERALVRLEKAIRVDRVGLTYEIAVTVTAGEPDRAQALAQAVVESYLTDQVRLKSDENRLDGEWLSQRVTELRQKLIQSEAAAEQIRHKYGLTETDKGPGSTIDRQEITELNGQLAQAEADLAAKKAQWDQVQRIQTAGGDLTSLPQAAADRVIQDLKVQKTEDLRQIGLLAAQTSAKYPVLQNARRDLDIINARIAGEVMQIVEGLHTDYETALARRDALQNSLHRLIAAQDNAVTATGRQELHQAETIVEANRQLYNALLNHWRDVELQSSRGQPEARILSDAKIPDRPSFPKPILFGGGGAVLGALLSAGIIILIPLLETRFITPTDLEKALGLQVLGSVPRLRNRDLTAGREKLGILDYVLRNPMSPIAESFRALRILIGSGAGESCRVVQFTSAVPGEGKSTIAGAFALSSASSGIRTLLLDVDARYPSVSNMFELERDEGLVDIIRGTTPALTATQPHKKLPLAIIGAGTKSFLQPDIASSRQLSKLVRELSTQFELIVLDSPPVLPVSDALAVAGFAHMTILVVEWRATKRAIAQQAVKALRQAGAPLAGVILSKIDPRCLSKGSYSYSLEYSQLAKPKEASGFWRHRWIA